MAQPDRFIPREEVLGRRLTPGTDDYKDMCDWLATFDWVEEVSHNGKGTVRVHTTGAHTFVVEPGDVAYVKRGTLYVASGEDFDRGYREIFDSIEDILDLVGEEIPGTIKVDEGQIEQAIRSAGQRRREAIAEAGVDSDEVEQVAEILAEAFHDRTLPHPLDQFTEMAIAVVKARS